MSHFLSVHCENICNGCVYDDICKPHIINTTIASEIMREEKIKRILYD